MQTLYKQNPDKVDEFLGLLKGKSVVYIDYANIKPWSKKLLWHIDEKRLKQFFNAIDIVENIRIYYGTLVGDRISEDFIKSLRALKYDVITKPVKKMKLSIDSRNVSEISPDLLRDFIRAPLLHQFTVEEIKYLNGILYRLNAQGAYYVEDRKCNFDVEIGRDMMFDFLKTDTDTYILFGGDSDFESPIRQLLNDGKNVILVATARRVSTELSLLKSEGLKIYEIKKLKEFLCWKKEMGS